MHGSHIILIEWWKSKHHFPSHSCSANGIHHTKRMHAEIFQMIFFPNSLAFFQYFDFFQIVHLLLVHLFLSIFFIRFPNMVSQYGFPIRFPNTFVQYIFSIRFFKMHFSNKFNFLMHSIFLRPIIVWKPVQMQPFLSRHIFSPFVLHTFFLTLLF